MRNWFSRRQIRQRNKRRGNRSLEIRRLLSEALEKRVLLTTVTSFDPPANATAAPLATDISASFDANINSATANSNTFAVHSAGRGQLVGSASVVTTSGATVTVDPSADFFPGEVVQATVTPSIQSVAGVASDPLVWQFRTAVEAGSGEFIPSEQVLDSGPSTSVVLADVDGDDDLDAFVTTSSANRILVNNNGQFSDSGQTLGDHNSLHASLGDLDGDGDLDAFVANAYQGNRVWLNNGGTFTDSGQQLGTFTSYSASLGDIDGDGDLDAFVANRLQGNRVWLNNGGVFSDSGQSLGTSDSYGASLGDLDGDGDLDAFVVNSYQGNRVWVNTNGTFADSGQSLGTHNSLGVSLGDLDGDGDLDAFVANYYEGNRVWINFGGVFADSGQSLGDHSSYSVQLGDLDGDGDLDAFATNAGQGNRVWRNDGGVFASGQPLGNHESFGAALGDVDADGDLDAFVANFGQNDRLWLNQSAVFSITPDLVAAAEGDAGASSINFTVTREFLAAGTATVDYAVIPSGSSPANILDFVGGALPTGTLTFGDGVTSMPLAIAINGDTDVENDETFSVFLTNPSGNALIGVGEATGSIRNDDNVDLGDLPAPFRTLLSDNGAAHLAVGPTLGTGRDTESDGQPSAAADGDGGDEDGVTFGAPLFAGQLNASATVNVSAPASLDAWIDFNGDGSFDAANEKIAASVAVVAGDNTLNFSVPASARQGQTFARFRVSTAGGLAPTGGAEDGEVEDHVLTITDPIGRNVFSDSGQQIGNQQSAGVALGDLDGDGDLDAFVANRYAGNTVWLSDGGTFVDSGASLGDHNSADVALGDLDGDGDLDAFIVNGGEGNRIWVNSGGQFTDTGQILGTSDSYGVVLADFDEDGDLDAFVANTGGNRVWINSGGLFSDSGQSLGASAGTDVAAGDVDGDGDVDVLVANSDGGNRVWLNARGTFSNGQELGDHATEGIALGDVDGDGDLDAISANYYQGNRVWLNNGGLFADSGQSLGTEDSSSVSLGDLDADGDLDLFVTNYGGNRIWLNANGVFSDSGQVLGASVSADGAVGDLDGDGDLDAFVANDSFNVTWRNENPTFSVVPQLLPQSEGNSGGSTMTFMVVREFDTTGAATVDFAFELGGVDPAELNDFVAGVLPSGTLTFADGEAAKPVSITVVGETVVENDESFLLTLSNPVGQDSVIGNGTGIGLILNDDGLDFGDLPAPFPTLLVDNGPSHLASGPRLGLSLDTEADGQPSAAADGDDANGVQDDEEGVVFAPLIFAGQVDAQVSVTASEAAKLDAWIDFNADGNFAGASEQIFAGLDVVAGENSLTFAIPADAAQGQTFARFRISSAGGLPPTGNAADGEVEDHQLTIGNPVGSSLFLPSIQLVGQGPLASRDVELGDLDRDGDLDAFVVNASQQNTVWLNDGNGSFTDTGQALGTHNSLDVALGDLDGDGDLDAFVANGYIHANRVWLNDGGVFTDTGQLLGARNSGAVSLGDLDGDGDLDAFVGNANDGNRIWLNQGGIFTDSGQALGSFNTTDVELGDLDGDGDLDAFTTNDNQADRVWLNNGGVFTDSTQTLGAYPSSAVSLGDLDGDGDLDALIAHVNQGGRIWFNDAGVFTNSGQSLGVEATRDVALGDLDGDGDLDAFAGNSGSQGNQVWWNYGGTFIDSSQNLGNHNTYGVALGDIDGDGDVDAFTTTVGQEHRLWQNPGSNFVVSPLLLVAAEGSDGTATFTFTIERDTDRGSGRLDFAVTPIGTDPADPADFVGGALPSGTVVVDDAVTSVPLVIETVGDTVVENDETFRLTLSYRDGSTLRTFTADGVIRNDDNIDLGDAPAGFPTLLLDNGPAHIANGPTLGSSRDSEPDGQPSPAADGDDATGTDDEDGITFGTAISAGQVAAQVTVNASGSGRLDAWIDFNGDNSFDLPTEQIFNARSVSAGDNLLTFSVPADARQGVTVARFRISSSGGLAPTGGAADGEVEDHTVTIGSSFGSGIFREGQGALGDRLGRDVAMGDLDGDGDLDAFVVNHGQGNRVWLNEGGTFVEGALGLGDHNSTSVALGDLDGDGDLDAFVANDTAQGNRIWLNDGGNFVSSGQVLGTATSQGVALGDLDRDGDLDAVVANSGQNRVWLNDGGVFTDSGQTLGAGATLGVALGDLDGDGDLDAFLANNSQPNRVWLNNAAQFTDSGLLLGNHASFAVSLGDLDGDGDLDAIVGNRNQGDRVWTNTGGSFTDSGQVLGDHHTSSLSLGDLDGDGDLDAFAAHNYQSNRIWLNESGVFGDSGQELGGLQSLGASLGDLDGDGDLDAFVANYRTGNRVWINENPTFSVLPAVLPLGEGNSGTTDFTFVVTRAFDTRGTATVDYAVALAGSNPAQLDDLVGGSLPTGTVTFADGVSSVPVTIEVAGDIAIEDDETFVLGIANPSTANAVVGAGQAVGIIINDDDVDLGDLPAPFATLLSDNGPAHLAVGPTLGLLRDAELDGQPSAAADGDDVAGSPDDEDGVTFTALLFPGALAAEASVVVAGGDAKLDAWIDFNGDGLFDPADEQIFANRDVTAGSNVLTFAVPAEAQQGQTYARFRLSTAGGLAPTGGAADGEVEDYTVQIEAPFGSGTFGENGQTLGDHSSLAVALGDVDGDGDLDAFVANSYGEGNRIWLNDAGIFTDSNQALGSHDSYSVSLGDLDGDGDLDAFVANSNQQGNRIWLNDAGSFSDSGQVLGNGSSFDVALGDFDQDGDLDAFVANSYQGNRLWINDGGVFSDSGQILGSHDSLGVSLGDLDGDGDLDAFVANYSQGNRVWLNNSGIFSDSGQSMGDHRSWDVALGDFDGDGDLDAFITNADHGDRVWVNDGGNFSDSGQVLGDHFNFGVALGDVDGDGDLDAFIASGDTGSVLVPASGNRIMLNDGGTFVDSGQSLGVSASFGVALGDLDADGDLDAFAANYYPTEENRVWLDLQARSLLAVAPTDADKEELNTGSSEFTFAVTRTGDTSGVSIVNFAVTGSGARPADADDFGGTLASGVVSFAAGETTQTIAVSVSGDTLREFDETFSVVISDATPDSAVITNATAEGIIRNDDGSPALLVTSLTGTNSGFVAEFNEPLDATVINLYDLASGENGPADAFLVGDSVGRVAGSLVVEDQRVTFIKTGGPLLPDNYTVTIRSAENGFKNLEGVLLDGDGNGLVGDDFVDSFTIAAPEANTVTVSVPDIVRGPGQAINVPANSDVGLPISLSPAAGVRSVNLQLTYDPAFLNITAASVADGVPAGAAVILNNTTPGLAILTFFSPADLPATGGAFVNLTASVPIADANAIYRGKQVLDLHTISIGDATATPFPVVDNDAIHVATFFGDVSGNGRINASDASRVGRVAALLDGGFEDSLLVDPLVVGDISGNGRLNAADASRVARFAALIPVDEIPPLPPLPVRPTSGPDPKLSIPRTLTVGAGGQVTAPVLIASTVDLQAPHRLTEADVVIQFDSSKLAVSSIDRGTFLDSNWSLTTTVDNELGRIVIVAHTGKPVAGTFSDVLVDINFVVRPDAAPGDTALNLLARAGNVFTDLVDETDHALELEGPVTNADNDPVDGLLTILAADAGAAYGGSAGLLREPERVVNSKTDETPRSTAEQSLQAEYPRTIDAALSEKSEDRNTPSLEQAPLEELDAALEELF